MPEKLPIISGKDAIKALTKLGFFVKRQKGSHVVLQKENKIITIPLHNTLKGASYAILKQAGVYVKELNKFL